LGFASGLISCAACPVFNSNSNSNHVVKITLNKLPANMYEICMFIGKVTNNLITLAKKQLDAAAPAQT